MNCKGSVGTVLQYVIYQQTDPLFVYRCESIEQVNFI